MWNVEFQLIDSLEEKGLADIFDFRVVSVRKLLVRFHIEQFRLGLSLNPIQTVEQLISNGIL